MFFRLMYHVVLPLYVAFVIFSSITLEKSLNTILVVALGLLFTASIFLDKWFNRQVLYLSAAQLGLLFAFHLTSQLNWCFSLYIILLSKVLFRVQGVIKAALLGFVFILFYTTARISYTPFNSYNILSVGSDFLTSLAVVLIIQYIIETEREKNQLKEAKKREEMLYQSEKMKIVGELAAGLAHEIRNPLTIIKGFLQHSKNRDYNIEPWYDLILGEVCRMNHLTVEFLQFSKPDVTLYHNQSMHECLQRVILLTETKARGLGHRVFYPNHNSELTVRMDFDKMVQVFVNLVNNALEAMHVPGSVTLHLYENRHEAVIEVCDTGGGIPQSALKDIFHPFFTTKEEGTGLGLSICQKIIQDHDGRIEVASKVDEGTTFTVRLPLHS